MRFVCDIDCILNADGSTTQVVKYETLELPESIIVSYESECESSSGSGSGGTDGGSTTTGILWFSMIANRGTPYLSYTFLGLPTGASYYTITVASPTGAVYYLSDPSTDDMEIANQVYAVLLNGEDGSADPPSGECLTFVARFYSATDELIDSSTRVVCMP
jgi:hypothetical protein